MTAYIGPLGGLVKIECPENLQSTVERPLAEKVTTSGVVRQQVSQRASRRWDFAVGEATPAEAAQLAALAAGEYGIGPFWFVDPWAQVTNLLAPAASTLESSPPSGMTAGGPVDLADGSRAGRSWVVANPATIHHTSYVDGTLSRVPVVNGTPACGSVYASGTTVDLRIQWYDATGAPLSATAYTSHSPGATMQRLWVYGNPPDGAHSASVQVRGATRWTRPALTWTPFLVDWHVGQGAPSVAIPASLSQDITQAFTGRQAEERLASVSVTISEVG